MTGFESPASQYAQSSLSLSDVLIQHPDAAYLCFAEGDSMQGDGIFHGDILIVSKSITAQDHDIVVANHNGVFLCKKIDIKNRRLLSSNKKFENYQLRDDEEFQIDGVVISSVRMHREFKKPLL